MSRLDTLLAVLDDDDSRPWRAKIRAFEIVLVLVIVTEFWATSYEYWPAGSPLRIPSLVLATLCGIAAVTARFRRPAFLVLMVSLIVAISISFPGTGNHSFLELVSCAMCALLDPSNPDEQRLFIRAVRWMTCVIMFFAGVQKLIHGYYTNGLMPAFLLMDPKFRPMFRLFLPLHEAQRILSYNGMAGAGPYLVSSPLFLLVSNFVWSFEIVVAFALIVPRLRTVTVFAALVFVALIEVAAREVFFGLLFVNLTLMFLKTDANRRLVPLIVATCVIMLLMQAGILPAVEFH